MCPNWCSNDISFYGEKSEVERLVEFVKTDKSEFDFNTAIPYPEKWAEIDAAWNNAFKSGFPNGNVTSAFSDMGGYQWCIDNWGTKWNAYEPSRSDVEMYYGGVSQVTYYFDTAWSPPIPVIKKLGELFPKLTIYMHYQEEGMMFEGEVQISNGEVFSERERELHEPEEEGEDY